MMRLSDAATVLGGALFGADREFDAVTIDTRTLQPGQLYVALRGQRLDGHEFLPQAQAAGASAALVERLSDACPGLPQLLIGDTRQALLNLAQHWRRRWNGPLVGITGSSGKTTAKEMLAAILSQRGPTLATTGNLNNDIGAPLMALRLTHAHRYAVLEMGANHAGEIALIAHHLQPNVSVITNAGAAHLEGFGSVDGVARAKGEMVAALAPDGVAVLNTDDAYFPYWCKLAAPRRVVSFGYLAAATVAVVPNTIQSTFSAGQFNTCFTLRLGDQPVSCRLALAGRHNVANAAAAAAAALVLGSDAAAIAAGLAVMRPVPRRLQPRLADCGALLLDDTYNANPSSFLAGVAVLGELGAGEPWVAMGALGELGADAAQLHGELGRQIRAAGAHRLYATGPHADQAVRAFGRGGYYFQQQEALIDTLRADLHPGCKLLVKGSRSQRMERVVAALCSDGGT